MANNWMRTKTGWVNIDRYDDIFVIKTSAGQYVIRITNENEPHSELSLGVFETRKEAEDSLDDAMIRTKKTY
jgi:hypothetical protein